MSKQTKNIIISCVVALALIGLAYGATKISVSDGGEGVSDAVSIVDGKQYIDITAKGGYSPRVVRAKANMPTVLRVTTKNTFDCSIAFTIPELGVRKMLGTTGVNEFDIPPQGVGKQMFATCSMGMYNFKIVYE